MASNDYHFVTRWRTEGCAEEVYDVLSDSPAFVRWWPQVYLDAKVISPGDEQGIGKIVRLHTRGRLPYTLHWDSVLVEKHRPYGFAIEARGDFQGRGIWSFEQDGRFVNITFDWKIRADKPLLRRLSFLLKPIFSANHRWAMARGEERLPAELARRRTQDSAFWT